MMKLSWKIMVAMLVVSSFAPLAAPASAPLLPLCRADETAPCEFTCRAGDQLYVMVDEGFGGTADCGGAMAGCPWLVSPIQPCIGSHPSAVAQYDDIGTCYVRQPLSSGSVTCFSAPAAPVTDTCFSTSGVVCAFHCPKDARIATAGVGYADCGGVYIDCWQGCTPTPAYGAPAGISSELTRFAEVGYCLANRSDGMSCSAVLDPLSQVS